MDDLDCFGRILLRHREPSIRKPEATNVAGVVRFHKRNVDNFFIINSNILANHEYIPIWRKFYIAVDLTHRKSEKNICEFYKK